MKSLRVEKLENDRGDSIFKLGGRFTVEDSMYLRDLLESSLEERPPFLILDCEELEQINSAAIGVFVGIKMKMSEYGGQIALSSLNQTILDVLKLTNVDLILPTYPSIQDAETGFHSAS